MFIYTYWKLFRTLCGLTYIIIVCTPSQNLGIQNNSLDLKVLFRFVGLPLALLRLNEDAVAPP